jgi:short-subunit dehydrogenase
METYARRLAVITGASSGLGLDLARQCAQNNYDLIIAADEASILEAAEDLAGSGITVRPVQCDLSSLEGVDALRNAITASGRPADILIANAGREVLDCTVNDRLMDARAYFEGTIYLIDQVSRSMRGRGQGRILITYSIAGLVSATSQAAHDSNKAFLSFFSMALCRELKHTGVTVTCLTPGKSRSNFFDGVARTPYLSEAASTELPAHPETSAPRRRAAAPTSTATLLPCSCWPPP